MRKLVSFMHVSLDGFVAGPNGEMNWIIVDEEIFDYAGYRTNEADTALYGRVTYEMMEAYWPTAADQPKASRHDIEHSTWYKKVEKVVLSRSWKDKKLPKTKIVSDNISGEINQLKQMPGEEIIIFGSPSASHSLMQENLIDEFWIFVNPILLGKGTPLFKDIKQQAKLKLIKCHAFSSGVVCLHYGKT
jgi:dihydrofolate reductase